MRKARYEGRTVVAGPDAPDVATCPACGCQVVKRSRRCMDKTVTWFYRHKRGEGKDCPKRYRPGM